MFYRKFYQSFQKIWVSWESYHHITNKQNHFEADGKYYASQVYKEIRTVFILLPNSFVNLSCKTYESACFEAWTVLIYYNIGTEMNSTFPSKIIYCWRPLIYFAEFHKKKRKKKKKPGKKRRKRISVLRANIRVIMHHTDLYNHGIREYVKKSLISF